jgi:hypothetical protein
MPMPSSGDCWYCALFQDDSGMRPTREGEQGMGDDMPTVYSDGTTGRQPNHDHLWSHIEERYYVPSLAVNALRERGYRDVGIYIHLNMNQDTQRMGGPGVFENVKRDITRYLTKRLVPAAPTK